MMVSLHKFWRFWLFKSAQEKRYIDAIEWFMEEFFQSINKNEVLSAYIIGSFVKRNMHDKSDIDLKIILKTGDSIEKGLDVAKEITGLAIKNKGIEIDCSIFAIDELVSGNFIAGKQCSRQLRPWQLTDKLPQGKILFGESLIFSDLHMKSELQKIDLSWQTVEYHLNAYRKLHDYKWLNITARLAIGLIHLLTDFENKTRTDFIRKTLIKQYEHDQSHLIHELMDVTQNPSKYSSKKEIERVYSRIADFLKKTEHLCPRKEKLS